jgi:hypothetical protein
MTAAAVFQLQPGTHITRLQEHMKKVAGRPGFIAMGTTPTSVTRSIFKMNIRV